MSIEEDRAFLYEMDTLIQDHPKTWMDHVPGASFHRLIKLFQNKKIYRIGFDLQSPLIQLVWSSSERDSSDEYAIRMLQHWHQKYGSDLAHWPDVLKPLLHDAINRIYREDRLLDGDGALFLFLIKVQSQLRIPYFSHFEPRHLHYLSEYPETFIDEAPFYLRNMLRYSKVMHEKSVPRHTISPAIQDLVTSNDTLLLFMCALQEHSPAETYLSFFPAKNMPSRQAKAFVHLSPKLIGPLSEVLSENDFEDVFSNVFEPDQSWDVSLHRVEYSHFSKKDTHLEFLKDTYPHALIYQFLHGSPPYMQASCAFVGRLFLEQFMSVTQAQWEVIFSSPRCTNLFDYLKDKSPEIYACWESLSHMMDATQMSSLLYQYCVDHFSRSSPPALLDASML